jgi:rare lipoprotein A (peptidoglycan hydrolase)/cell division septation protein DedD
MKHLLIVLALCAFTDLSAQSFEWNSKSPSSAHPNEVQPAQTNLATYEKAYNERQSGMAGIYNPNLNGSSTVYGETYKSTELTASHTILPLGTLIRLVNLDNNRNVTVRVNDRGQECPDCLVMLSQAAADQLGINYRGRVSVERVGFSNWNPAPPLATSPAPVAYGNPAPVTTYRNTPATGGQPGVVRPVTIEGEAYGWQSKGNDHRPASYGTPQPAAYGQTSQAPQTYSRPATYGTPAPSSDNYAVMSAPQTNSGSVMSREVYPTATATQPAITYSRRPTTVTPQPAAINSTPSVQTTVQPQVYQSTPRAYGSTPQPTAVSQAAPPPSTVVRYQENRTVQAPPTYNTPAPVAYGNTTTARGVSQPTTTTTAPAISPSGYAVQLGAYNNELYAKNRVNQLKQAGISNVFYLSARKNDGQIINRVYAGTFGSMADAQVAANNIRTGHQIAGIVTSL